MLGGPGPPPHGCQGFATLCTMLGGPGPPPHGCHRWLGFATLCTMLGGPGLPLDCRNNIAGVSGCRRPRARDLQPWCGYSRGIPAPGMLPRGSGPSLLCRSSTGLATPCTRPGVLHLCEAAVQVLRRRGACCQADHTGQLGATLEYVVGSTASRLRGAARRPPCQVSLVVRASTARRTAVQVRRRESLTSTRGMPSKSGGRFRSGGCPPSSTAPPPWAD